MRFGELLLFNTKSDCLETAWVSSWGSGLSIWIEIVLWKQGVSFWKHPKSQTDQVGIWYLEGLYYGIKHQIVLKLFELHPWVVDCQSELQLFCGNRDFPLKAIQNHRQKTWNMRFGELLLFNTTSDCLETAWVSSWVVDCQSELKLFCGKTGTFVF